MPNFGRLWLSNKFFECGDISVWADIAPIDLPMSNGVFDEDEYYSMVEALIARELKLEENL